MVTDSEERMKLKTVGFFETVLKIGFGVAFGFLIYESVTPLGTLFWTF